MTRGIQILKENYGMPYVLLKTFYQVGEGMPTRVTIHGKYNIQNEKIIIPKPFYDLHEDILRRDVKPKIADSIIKKGFNVATGLDVYAKLYFMSETMSGSFPMNSSYVIKLNEVKGLGFLTEEGYAGMFKEGAFTWRFDKEHVEYIGKSLNLLDENSRDKWPDYRRIVELQENLKK
ncbi:MAG: hypothetical protein PHX96_01795, partial [Candidatus Nanoarchaeia archaeon]|nr:hypothetical protein [Candidatus Nanoarchaeia archaeon]